MRPGRVVAPGTPGELWVSAPTVMAGYWRRPDLDERSLQPRAGAPAWYATGDVVVADADGVYWFKGRRDHQVKVRGVRIELEAVESVLTDAPDVLHAVVAAIGEPGEASHLAAAVVLRDGATLDVEALRAFCISSASGPRRAARDRCPFQLPVHTDQQDRPPQRSGRSRLGGRLMKGTRTA